VGTGGCLFCSPGGSGDFAGDGHVGIAGQFADVRRRTLKKWPYARYIAYFQSYTSTYGDPDRLAALVREAKCLPDVVGTVLSTRPDCLGDDVMAVLAEPATRPLWLEVGLQSIHDASLVTMNRGHDFPCFLDALERLRGHDIPVCAHIIMGLPWETREMMLETARRVAQMPLQGIKIHALYIVKGSPLGRIWEEREEGEEGEEGGVGAIWDGRGERGAGSHIPHPTAPFSLLSRQEYVELIADILEIMPQEFLIHRLTGDGRYRDVLAPAWTLAKWEVLNAIDREMEKRGSWQGAYATKL
jgi:radical SAM superfamily enzyme